MPRDKLHIENKDTALQNLFLRFQAKVRLTNDILFIESLIAPTEPRLFYVNNFEVHIFVLNMNVKPKRLTTPGTVKLTQRVSGSSCKKLIYFATLKGSSNLDQRGVACNLLNLSKKGLTLVFQTLEGAIHRINHYPGDT